METKLQTQWNISHRPQMHRKFITRNAFKVSATPVPDLDQNQKQLFINALIPCLGTIIANFTTPDESHLYGLPLSLYRLLRPLRPFLSFDVSLTIPKNMCKLLYATFKPLIAYIHRLTTKTAYIGMCTKSKSFWSFP